MSREVGEDVDLIFKSADELLLMGDSEVDGLDSNLFVGGETSAEVDSGEGSLPQDISGIVREVSNPLRGWCCCPLHLTILSVKVAIMMPIITLL